MSSTTFSDYKVTFCSVEFNDTYQIEQFRNHLRLRLNGSTVEPIIATQKLETGTLVYCRNDDAAHLMDFAYLNKLTPTRFNITCQLLPEGLTHPGAVDVKYHIWRSAIATICRKVYPRLTPLERIDGINASIEFGKPTADCRLILQTDKSLLRLSGYQVLADFQCRALDAKLFWDFARSNTQDGYSQLPLILFQVGVQSWLDTIDPFGKGFNVDNIIPDFVEKPEQNSTPHARTRRLFKAIYNLAQSSPDPTAYLEWVSGITLAMRREYPDYPVILEPGITPATKKG
jgi:hypothetical protein